MGAKGRKSLTNKLQQKALQRVEASAKKEAAPADYLPLEGGPARKLPVQKEPVDKATVLYIGRIPHGFYEDEMKAFFSQFGVVKRLRLARNRKTGRSKHYGYIEFLSPEVAKIAAEAMHNHLLFEHLLQVYLVLPERVHPKLWKGASRRYEPLNWVEIERKRQDKERTLQEHHKLVEGILKKDKKRRRKIEAAGIDYECPEFVGETLVIPKKIRFE
uniref:RRM domain-containing protein n=1 Tax=Kalanchoe fedtschenkoi TaxID=63787 RepID=A0A7N0RJ69_KALFE